MTYATAIRIKTYLASMMNDPRKDGFMLLMDS